MPLDKLQQIPHTVASVSDYELLARERLTDQVWAYLAGSAADEITLRANIEAFQRLSLKPRILEDLSGGGTQIDLFGSRLAFPVLLAPVAFQTMLHPDGEIASAVAASAMQTGMIVSTQAGRTIEDIAKAATAPLWFQLYIQPDREFTLQLVRRAEEAGYRALVVTVDAPVSGLRNREQRAGFSFPPGVEAVNFRGMRAPDPHHAAAGSPVLLGSPLLAAAPTWRDIAWLRSQTKLPVLIKGITNAGNAKRALDEGVDGLIVSNHGGRVLDTLPATVSVLPEIAQTVGRKVPVLMDGGIRRGSDVFKALALGADAILVGRPFAFGLAAAGATGVSHVLNILRAELEFTMALTGCVNLQSIGREFVQTD